MGKIIKDGVEYNFGGGSGGSGVSIDVLDTMSEINSNTESDKAAGALAVKELDNSIDDKLAVSSTRTEFTSTKDIVKERTRILGTVTNGGSPYLEFGHYPANSSNAEDLLALHYDGTGFKIQGIKDSSEIVTKTIATADDINSLRTSFQAGYSTIADAITEKGITIADNASPEEIAEAINQIIEVSTVPQKKMYYLGQAIFSGALLTTSRHFEFDFSHIPNYQNLTLDDFFVGMGGNRIYMATNGTTGYLAFEMRGDGIISLKWFGDARKSVCSLNCCVYCLGDSDELSSGGDSNIPEIKTQNYSLTLTGSGGRKSASQDISGLGTVLGYGVTSVKTEYNCYDNTVDTISASCSMSNNVVTVSVGKSGGDNNYLTGSATATLTVWYY